MARAILFDLDMTLVDSSAVADLRKAQLWPLVKTSMHLIRPFPPQSGKSPHQIPARFKEAGDVVGIVTSAPEWYAKSVLEQFEIPYDVLVSYGDTENHKPGPEPIQEALKRLGLPASPLSLYVGDDAVDVEASFHAGVTSVGVSWGLGTAFGLASSAPDIFVDKPSVLLNTAKLDGRGYIGEALTSGWPFEPHWGSVLYCDEEPAVAALGRYFTTSDPRHGDSALCSAILSLKKGDDQAGVLGEALGRAIALMDLVPDFAIPVPMKPSQTRQRFAKVFESAEPHMDGDIEICADGLKCVKEVEEYKQKDALERREAIKGAFETGYNWNGASILLIDDVYTTGETIKECIRVLQGSGAGEIRVLVLGKDQRTFMYKRCHACGRSMRVRVNGKTQEKFWGCSGYPDYCQNTENL